MALTSQAAPIASALWLFGAFVYRLGHGPLKAERRVRFPYALPLKFNHLRKSAGKVQEDQVASAKFFPQISFGEEFFNPAGTRREKNGSGKCRRSARTNFSGTKV